MDIQGQNEEAEIQALQEQSSQQRITELEQELSQAQQLAQNNEAANLILRRMVNEGELEQDDNGDVRVSKRKSREASLIGNDDDYD